MKRKTNTNNPPDLHNDAELSDSYREVRAINKHIEHRTVKEKGFKTSFI